MSEQNPQTEERSDMTTVRRLMLEQLQALRSAPAGEALAQELKRAKGVSELSATIIDSARVEVEYLQVIHGDGEVPFLESGGQRGLPAPTKGSATAAGLPTAHQPFGSNVHRLEG